LLGVVLQVVVTLRTIGRDPGDCQSRVLCAQLHREVSLHAAIVNERSPPGQNRVRNSTAVRSAQRPS